MSARTWKQVDVHLHSLDVGEEVLAQILPVLSTDELERSRSAHDPAARRRTLAARGMLRDVLADYLDVDPVSLAFEYGPRGKPSLAGRLGQRLRFSSSRSGGVAVLAVAFGREVGIDVERVDRKRALGPIAEQLFAPAEAAELRALSPQERTRRFFEIWTRTEAYAKALGIGLAIPLRRVDAGSGGRLPGGWSLHDLPLGTGLAGALCVQGAGARVQMCPPLRLARA